MAGPSAPNTTAVIQELQLLLQALKLADNVTSAYQTVIIGGEKDYTTIPLPCAVIIPRHDDSSRHAHGGTIVEHTDLEIRTVCDYTIASAAELQVIGIRDALMPLLNKYAVWPNCPTSYHSQVKPNSGHYGWMWLKPNWYRIHSVMLEIAQYYVVPGGIQ